MQNKKIFTIGGSGLVGSSINNVLAQSMDVDNVSLESGVDIRKPESLSFIEKDEEHDAVILYAAKADVDGCELDKAKGVEGDAYLINVIGVRNVINALRKNNKKLIYISTDFVFNGENTPESGYSEEDNPDPVNWYAHTKYLAEEEVKNSGLSYNIIRLGYPYRTDVFEGKQDFVHIFINRLSKNLPIAGITDHIMTPSLLSDAGSGMDLIIKNSHAGIYHLTGSESITPYDAACKIADIFGYDKRLITKTTRDEYFKGKAKRPFNLKMNNDKIHKLGFKTHTFEQGLIKIKDQILSRNKIS